MTGATAAALGLAESGPLFRCLAQTIPEPPASRRFDERVVEVRSDHVIRGRQIHTGVLRNMLGSSLTQLTGRSGEAEAWAALLSPQDIIGVKFNRSGAEAIGTTPAMVEALVTSLGEAGWGPTQIVAIEIPEELYSKHQLTRPRLDWLPEDIKIGNVLDRLSGLLDQVTAIVNVPFLKSHNLAGMTCALKNLSHALVKHPAQFHRDGCAPVADIVALPQIRSKLRLHVVNALRVVFDHGPEVQEEFIAERGSLLLGTDAVAVDAVSLEFMNQVRTSLGLERIWNGERGLSYLSAAARIKLGQSDLHEIEWLKSTVS